MNEVLRTDLLDHGMNAGKEQRVFELLRAWRACAVLVGREQWRLFFEDGSFNKNHRNERELALAHVVGAANRLQMVRYQVVGILGSHMANRQNDFSRLVECSTLPKDVRHQLHFVNRWRAWFGREPLTMKDGAEIPNETRRLARQIMRRVLSRHRKPDCSGINMVIDRRAAKLREAEDATAFDLWVRLSTMTPRQPIEIPLRAHRHFRKRPGRRAQTVQVNERDGRLFFGVVTDMAPACAEQKQAYRPRCEEIGLDYGLRTLFATDQGDLLGQGFLRQFGIEVVRVNPAYSSQTCSACDYVDKKNRTGERFECSWCGRTLNADVNASRNLRARRSRPAVGSVKQAKAAVLRAQVLEFQRLSAERWGNPKGRRGTSRDPREQNAYFRRYAPEVTSIGAIATSANAACATGP